MNFKLRILLVVIAAFAALAPVCVLAGGDTKQTSQQIELTGQAIVELVGENAEVRIHGIESNTLELNATLHNEQYVDFFTQILSDRPGSHLRITATTSAGGDTTANSIIELGIPSGVELKIQTTNRLISIDNVTVSSATLSSVDGKISITNSSGNFDLNTTNSEITVQEVDGVVNAATSNAHVWFEGVINSGSNSISTTNGEIAVRLQSGSDVAITGNTHNGDVSVNGGDDGVEMNGDAASVSYRVGDGPATLKITNGPGGIHINPDTIAVFDGDE